MIRGAIEVLLDQGRIDAVSARRLKRIQRGADELRDLLDALLVLARGDERPSGDARVRDLDNLVDDLLRDRQDALREKNLEVVRERESGVAIAAPAKVLGVVIGNLLRSVTQFAEGGVLRVALALSESSIGCSGAGEPANAADQRSNEIRREQPGAQATLGLGMIRRVCERWGWTLDENIDQDGRHGYALRFG